MMRPPSSSIQTQTPTKPLRTALHRRLLSSSSSVSPGARRQERNIHVVRPPSSRRLLTGKPLMPLLFVVASTLAAAGAGGVATGRRFADASPATTTAAAFVGLAGADWYRSTWSLRRVVQPRPTTPSTITSSPSITMGMQIKIRIVGKKGGGERWLDDAYKTYEKRLRPSGVSVETAWHRTDDDLVAKVKADRERGHSIVLLDPLGRQRTSEKFATDLYAWLERGGSRLVFVIGGADGLPAELREEIRGTSAGGVGDGKQGRGRGTGGGPSNSNAMSLSLSDLTFTHQFARTLLMEQIYRATEIRKGVYWCTGS